MTNHADNKIKSAESITVLVQSVICPHCEAEQEGCTSEKFDKLNYVKYILSRRLFIEIGHWRSD